MLKQIRDQTSKRCSLEDKYWRGTVLLRMSIEVFVWLFVLFFWQIGLTYMSSKRDSFKEKGCGE